MDHVKIPPSGSCTSTPAHSDSQLIGLSSSEISTVDSVVSNAGGSCEFVTFIASGYEETPPNSSDTLMIIS